MEWRVQRCSQRRRLEAGGAGFNSKVNGFNSITPTAVFPGAEGAAEEVEDASREGCASEWGVPYELALPEPDLEGVRSSGVCAESKPREEEEAEEGVKARPAAPPKDMPPVVPDMEAEPASIAYEEEEEGEEGVEGA